MVHWWYQYQLSRLVGCRFNLFDTAASIPIFRHSKIDSYLSVAVSWDLLGFRVCADLLLITIIYFKWYIPNDSRKSTTRGC